MNVTLERILLNFVSNILKVISKAWEQPLVTVTIVSHKYSSSLLVRYAGAFLSPCIINH